MPRIRRMIIQDGPGVYHVISRTALTGLPFKDVDKDKLLSIIRRYSKLFFVEILGFSLMGNHFHLVVRMLPQDRVTVDEIGLIQGQPLYGNICLTCLTNRYIDT